MTQEEIHEPHTLATRSFSERLDGLAPSVAPH